MEEYGKKVLHPSQETEEYLVEEIKKVCLDHLPVVSAYLVGNM